MNNFIALIIVTILTMISPVTVTANDTMELTISGILEDAPECSINGNDIIDVDFGDEVYASKIDGKTYKKVPLVGDITCNPSMLSNRLKLKIMSTSGEGFEPGLIGTDIDGLAIKLLTDNGKLATGSELNFTYFGTQSIPTIYAVPVLQDSISVLPGEFTGTATLVISYQ